MTKLTKTIAVKSVAWDTIQQLPHGSVSFHHMPVLYVNGKLTTIAGEVATHYKKACTIARDAAVELAKKNGLVATRYAGDPPVTGPRNAKERAADKAWAKKGVRTIYDKPAKTEGIYVLKDAKIPKKQVWKKVASVPVKTVKPSKATLIFTTPEFNFKGTIRRAIKLLTEDYKYMGGVGRPCLCNECGWDWGKHKPKCKVAKLLADLKHCLDYGRPS